ncbi:SdiA-regulated domain-containing protein [bacterium]|nr:SdiA-regulated domain-containing protein [bacterium]
MNRWIWFRFLILCVAMACAQGVLSFNDPGPRLTYIERFDIAYTAEGLSEPSGLALTDGWQALWTVSDDTKNIFKLNLDGELQNGESFEIPEAGLEGIALGPAGHCLFTVNENANEIIKLDVQTQRVADRKGLSQIAGYTHIASYFDNSPPNKGLKGISWNTDTGIIFVMKEGVPGMLLELSLDLETIQNYILLNDENGFSDNNIHGSKLDFSGICYDPSRKCFWIVSDKGQRLFLYDWQKNRVLYNLALSYGTKGKVQEIKKPEGVAIDSGSNRLFVVSDKEARLYLFDIRE